VHVDPPANGDTSAPRRRGRCTTGEEENGTRGRAAGRQGRGSGRHIVEVPPMTERPSILNSDGAREPVDATTVEQGPPAMLAATQRWVLPTIVPNARSPFRLKPRSSTGQIFNSNFDSRRSFHAFSDGTSADPIRIPGDDEVPSHRNLDGVAQVLGENSRRQAPNSKGGCEELWDITDDDCVIIGGNGFQTPLRGPPRREESALPEATRPVPSDGICRFTIQDFTPGAECPNSYLRQSLGEYLPWLHNCGEQACPFTEPAPHMRRLSLETGQPLPNSQLSPGDHVRVDYRAFVDEVHVKVSLDLLGYDRGMWGGLQYFTGAIVDCYYHDVTSFPIFTINFRGSIGKREVKVADTVADPTRAVGDATQRSLDFGSPSPARLMLPRSMPTHAGSPFHGPSGESSSRGPMREKPPLHGRSAILDADFLRTSAPLLSDSDMDMDWMAELEDFEGANGRDTGMLLPMNFVVCAVFVSEHFPYSSPYNF
jgi:hypothetical protein